MMNILLIKRIIAWTLLAVTLFYLLTGFGITNSSTVDSLTLGLLGKAMSFRLHEILWIPFIILLAAHVFLNTLMKIWKRSASNRPRP
ncbi:hypothetical protein MCP_2089 [Methanocella paludicola SANAE]|uniref:DUF4405 domain-containing protein n=1 Tax=Methanocella paludicola (strain DSM 17711 / JCM 13418 / NBRC 101707 / SANAE) TaxID=304371 RepID=D1Z0D9_METPS|nr:hypothetical protein MCP_2089 [Methanocella paludicola SANAE]